MEASRFPLTYDVTYPQQLSRGLIFVKWLFIIPHGLILNVLNGVQSVIALIAFFAILFHPPLSARALRLHGRCQPLERQRRSLHPADERRVPALRSGGREVPGDL